MNVTLLAGSLSAQRLRRSIAATTLVACATLTCCSFIGCAGPKPAPRVMQGKVVQDKVVQADARTGTLPPVAITTVASAIAGQSLHAVTITAPSTGYSAFLDQERAANGRRDVYITLRKPSPLFVHAQVQTEHTVATSVPVGEAIAVYLRLAEAGVRVGDDEAYVAAVQKP